MAASASASPGGNGERKPRVCIAVSACLLGEPVRYDGTDKRHGWLLEQLGQVAQLLPVCPEQQAGLGVPRERINLVQAAPGQVRVVGEESGRDVTEPLERFAQRWLEAQPPWRLCGAVLKSRSPSCATGDARLLSPEGELLGRSWGLFAQQLRRRWPWLPVVDEQQLGRPEDCSGFLVRVFLLGRLLAAVQAGPQGLARFHAREWLLLAALAPEQISSLDELAARLGVLGDTEAVEPYRQQVLEMVGQADEAQRHLRAWWMWLENYVADEALQDEAMDVVEASLAASREPWCAGPQVLEKLQQRHFPQLARQSYARPWPPELRLPQQTGSGSRR